mgnify:CR=1 FL=1
MRVIIIALFSLFIGLVSTSAFASTKSTLVDGLASCKKVPNDAQRLVCFDQLTEIHVAPLSSTIVNVEPVTPEVNVEPATPKVIVEPATPKVIVEPVTAIEQSKSQESKIIDDFSKDDLKKTEEEKGPESITATISNLKKLIRGQWVIYFENGQKWQQKDSGKISLKVGDTVRLKKGSMETVYLFKEGGHRNIRVKRLK